MADLAVSTIVSRVEAKVTALSGWTLAPMPVDLLARSTRPLLHQSASVFARSTTMRIGGSPVGRRQGPSAGGYANTHLTVQWAYRVRPDAYASDIRGAYDAEATLIQALIAATATNLHLQIERFDRELLDTRTAILGTILIRVTHSLDLLA